MAAGNSVHDEIKEQRQKMKDMDAKGKLSYFWHYYKIHTIGVLFGMFVVVSYIWQVKTNKPCAFYAVLINGASDTENTDTPVIWGQEFMAFAGIDPESYQVMIDPSLMLSTDGGDQYEAASRQKLSAQMAAGDIHAVLADSGIFESYAHQEYFYDLSAVFTPEELAPYADLLYYTDAAAFPDENATWEEEVAASIAYYEKAIDHSDPASMEQPVPVGIRIPATDNKLAEAGYYRYLEEQGQTFQGHPAKAVIGLPYSTEDPSLFLRFVAYLMQA